MFCSVFPMLTPGIYSVIIEQMTINAYSRITAIRMQPHYRGKPKKRKK